MQRLHGESFTLLQPSGDQLDAHAPRITTLIKQSLREEQHQTGYVGRPDVLRTVLARENGCVGEDSNGGVRRRRTRYPGRATEVALMFLVGPRRVRCVGREDSSRRSSCVVVARVGRSRGRSGGGVNPPGNVC